MRKALLVAGVICTLVLTFFAERKTAPTMQSTAETVLVASTSQTASVALASDTYPVVKVVDGDTLTILKDGKNETLRLIGVDTPETVDPRKPVQCFGKVASDEAHTLLDGKSVQLELDPSQGEFDRYGRTLAYVYLPDGTLFNEFLIAEGYGHEYTYHLPYKYQKEFKAAEVKARTDGRGLWAAGVCGPSVKSSVAPTAGAFAPTKTYDCTKNVYNCASFSSQAEAQYVFDQCGGDANDVHKLDSDKDGRVCESLP